MLRRLFIKTLFISALLGSGLAMAGEATTVLNVEGMTCKFCTITVKKSLEKVDGVVRAEVDLEAKQATVVYDDSKTNPEALATVVTEAGYSATVK